MKRTIGPIRLSGIPNQRQNETVRGLVGVVATAAGRRPVLLLSRTRAYSTLNKVAVAEITSNVRRIGVEVPLGKDEGLPRSSAANLDNIRTVPISALVEKIGTLSVGRHHVVKRALGYAFDLDELLQATPTKAE